MNPNQRLPAVDRVLQQLPALIETHGRQLVTGCVRAELAAAREGIKHGLPLPDEAALLAAIGRRADASARANLGPVFNLTGTVLCILTAIPLFGAMMVNSGIVMNAAVCVLLVLVACGVFAFVLGGTYYGATEKLLEEGDYTRHSKATRELRTAISVVYWLVVTGAFLLYTFGPKGNGQPQYSWFIWAIGGILYAALVLVVKMALRKQNNK